MGVKLGRTTQRQSVAGKSFCRREGNLSDGGRTDLLSSRGKEGRHGERDMEYYLLFLFSHDQT